MADDNNDPGKVNPSPKKTYKGQLIDPDHPFFMVKWRRQASAYVPLIWSGFELYMGSVLFATLFFAAGAYAYWMLIWTYKEKPVATPEKAE
jgi:hypothetical protein